MFFLLLHYSFLINFVAGSNTFKFILRGFVELHCLGAFLVDATDDSGFQWFGNSVVDLVPIKNMADSNAWLHPGPARREIDSVY